MKTAGHVRLQIQTDVPRTPRPPAKTRTTAQRPQSARTYGKEAEPSAHGRVALSARQPEKRAWGGGDGVDAFLSPKGERGTGRHLQAKSPIRPMPVLTPRTPRHQKAIQDANSASTPPLSPLGQSGHIDSAMNYIIYEELYRAREYPDTAHITPSLVPGSGTEKTETHRSRSPTRGVQSVLLDLRKESVAFRAPDLLDQWLVRIFSAKCIDLKIKPSTQRRDRFLDTIKITSRSDMINLSQSGMGPLGAAAIAAMMLELQFTERFLALDLSGNVLGDTGSVAVAEMLANHQSLTHLDLRSNNIGVEGGLALFEAVIVNSTLTDLDLGILAGGSRNRVGLKVSEAIGRALKTNKSLTHLSLHGNGMGVEGSVNFAKGLAGNHILKRLDISLNHLKDEGTVNIAAALELGAQLESLNLSHNAIGTRGTMRLAQAISSGNLFIRSLDLSTNALGGKAANLLGEALCTNSQLATLILDHNPLGAEGGTGLAHGLQGAGGLKSLSLCNTSLTDAGVQALAVQLHGSRTVTKLDLTNNGIGDPGAGALAAMLRHNGTLAWLVLEENQVGDIGGLALGHALLSNTSLHGLNLKDNLIHDATGSAFVETLMCNTALTSLDIDNNDLNYATYSSVEKLKREHARAWKLSSAPRLQMELDRLRKLEPMLAVREAELLQLVNERKQLQDEAARNTSEAEDTAQYTTDKLEELQQGLDEASAELADRKSELDTLLATMDEEQKIRDAAEHKADRRKRLVEDEVRQRARALEKVQQETAEVTKDAEAEEARLLAQVRYFRHRASAAQVARDENVGKIKEFEGEDFDVEALLEQASTVDMTNAVRYYVTPPDSPDPDVQGGDVVEIELGVGGEKGVEADVIGESAGAGGGAGKQGGEGVGVGKEGEGGAGARAGKGEGGDGAKRTDSVEMVDSSVSKGVPETKVFRK